MLKADRLKIEYAKLLFENVSFVIGNREKIGLVGLNGCGKSTLLKLIVGEEKPTSGSIEIVNEKLGYLPQIFDITENNKYELVGEYCESLVNGIAEIWKVNKVLNKLKLTEVDEFTPISTLSPGQKMKLYLAKLLLAESTILLLDEPTNHLDLEGISWLEDFISRFDGVCIMISHDREFLNQAVNHIFEIDDQQLFVYEGNYDDYIDGKVERLEKLAQQYNLQEKRREKLENLIALAKKQGSGKKQKTRLSSARKRLEREVTRGEIFEYKANKLGEFQLAGEVHRSKKILNVSGLNFSYKGSKNLLNNINLEVYGSERIWLKGNNGTGKSTLIKLLTGELAPLAGKIEWGANLSWKYFAQDQSQLNIHDSVQKYFFSQTNIPWDRSFGILEKFLFDKDLRDQKVINLSPGQKSRLSFAIFAQQKYECLILDEPTNHLDIETKEAIEESLRNFGGTIILVSHDRYFANQLEPDRIFTIDRGSLIQIEN